MPNKVPVEKEIAYDLVVNINRFMAALTGMEAKLEQGNSGGFAFTQATFDGDARIAPIDRLDFLELRDVIAGTITYLQTTDFSGSPAIEYLYRVMDGPVK